MKVEVCQLADRETCRIAFVVMRGRQQPTFHPDGIWANHRHLPDTTFRYAFQQGLFPGVVNRPEGVMVNGVIVTSDLSFPQTGNFETFDTLSMLVPLNAGVNTIQLFNVATQSVSRMDVMTVTEGGVANCSVLPGVPTSLTASEDFGGDSIKLQWNASSSTTGCTVGYYNVYRSNSSSFTPWPSNQSRNGRLRIDV
jgi:hypothetical protein